MTGDRTPPPNQPPPGQSPPDRPQAVLDARGRRCPIPIIELARHIGDVDVGQLIELWADDPAAAADVAAWCRMRGHALVVERTRAAGPGSVPPGETPDGAESPPAGASPPGGGDAYLVRRLR
ncbi:sulfurtransferase TusA family protein [Frankia sp. Cpl3]|uniref:sulfurtransferase TusA family protein n=1 Tax=Parafrankia colletiae TaxID=573497 RepID=UPI000B08356A|nr:sulfurtransferase TusA family protein [Parafrankia colletiae]MCK9904378.1 sulfurtransferase TusA family protein [Frankia sp. Cpl3]